MLLNKKTCAVLTATAAAGLFSASASAVTINFDQATGNDPNGTLSYDGEGGALTASNISFGQINLLNGNSPAESTLNCVSCTLSFSTGANISEGPQGGWGFAEGGDFTLSGTATDSNGNVVAGGDNPLLTGAFTSNNGDAAVNVFSSNDQSVRVIASGASMTNSDLLTYFGFTPGEDGTFVNSVFSTNNATINADNGGFFGDVTGSDINVTPPTQTTPVPEPSELGLFGLGMALIGGGLFMRRRNKGLNRFNAQMA